MIRLLLSILGPVLFLANYWVCKFTYPYDPTKCESWIIFIPMDMLCHNFYAAVIFVYAFSTMFKITMPITYYFIYLGIWFSFFDIIARLSGKTNFDAVLYVITLLSSLILAGVCYAAKRKYTN